MASILTHTNKAVRGIGNKIFTLRILPLILFMLFLTASCEKELTRYSEIQMSRGQVSDN